MRRRVACGLVPFLALGAVVTVGSSPALAACHAFTVSVSPSTVTEGGKVMATVSRDGDLDASNIDVSTVNETAKSPGDYIAIHQTIQFGGAGSGDLSRTIQISTVNDSVHESTETFRVHLSNPGGCSINPNYSVGPDARATIRDNDAAPKPTPTPTPTKKSSATATASAKPTVTTTSPTPTSSAKPSPRVSRTTSSVSSSPSALAAAADTTSGGNGGLIAGIVVAVLAVGASTLFFVRRQRRA